MPEQEAKLTRRRFLRSAFVGGSGLLAAYAVGCGDDEPAAPRVPPLGLLPTPTSISTATPAPTPGVMRWQRLEASGELPSGRTDHSIVINEGTLLVFGGRADGVPQGDVWAFDLTTNSWLQPAVGSGPEARFGHNAVSEASGKRMFIFGGQAGGSFFNDVWVLDINTGWRQVGASVGPSQRYGAASAVDDGGRLLISHGFTDRGRFDDTWSMDASAAWSDMSPSGTRPVKRCLCRGAWDSNRNRFLMFGGQTDGTPFLGDFWMFDAAGWQEITSEPKPSPRNFYAMAETDPGRIALFGGNTVDGPGPTNDLWFFDSQSDTWTLAQPEGEAPSARYGHDAVWLPESRRLIVFGGHDITGDLNDLWELTIPG